MHDVNQECRYHEATGLTSGRIAVMPRPSIGQNGTGLLDTTLFEFGLGQQSLVSAVPPNSLDTRAVA
jgi:hypothetical protein